MTARLRRADPVLLGLWIALLVAAILWAAPFIFITLTAFKTRPDLVRTGAFGLPTALAWQNFATAWDRADLAVTARNSALIALTKVPIGLFISSLAAYALTRMRFRWQKTLFLLITIGTMIPVQVALGPLFRLVLSMGLLNKYLGILLPYIAFGVPYQVFILRGFFSNIPRELDEAAYMDGASHFDVYRRIILPVAKPALAALFILDFVATWNEFPIALVILQRQEAWTIPLSLQAFTGQFGNNYTEMNAAIVMAILPVIIVYMLFQRYFVSGLVSGAVKG
jgi:raffinose/stachyose/melibiose transport system permease protein